MKRDEILMGETYLVKMQSGKLIIARIERGATTWKGRKLRGFVCTNMDTGREVKIKSEIQVKVRVERTGEIGGWRRHSGEVAS